MYKISADDLHRLNTQLRQGNPTIIAAMGEMLKKIPENNHDVDLHHYNIGNPNHSIKDIVTKALREHVVNPIFNTDIPEDEFDLNRLTSLINQIGWNNDLNKLIDLSRQEAVALPDKTKASFWHSAQALLFKANLNNEQTYLLKDNSPRDYGAFKQRL